MAKMIISIRLPDGELLRGVCNDQCWTKDGSSFMFESVHNKSGKTFTVRVDSEEIHNDRVKRNIELNNE